jgi:hypothetical protein
MLHVWYIYLQNWVIYGVNVGKYSSTMEHMGCRIDVYKTILHVPPRPPKKDMFWRNERQSIRIYILNLTNHPTPNLPIQHDPTWTFPRPYSSPFLGTQASPSPVRARTAWSIRVACFGLSPRFDRKGGRNTKWTLVVLTILKNISQWEGLSHLLLWKIKNVWNHQPVNSWKEQQRITLNVLIEPKILHSHQP